MKQTDHRYTRLLRLERIRDVAKQAALADLAEAEHRLAQAHGLSVRVRQLQDAYAARTDARDGYALRLQSRFTQAMAPVAQHVSSDAVGARTLADHRLRTLEMRERQRAAAEDARSGVERALKTASGSVPTGAMRRNGTLLEG